jgi:hypothetical protein
MTLAFMREMLGDGVLVLSLCHGFRAASARLQRLILLLGFGAALVTPLLAIGLPEWPAPRIVVPIAASRTWLNMIVDHAEVSAAGAPASGACRLQPFRGREPARPGRG